MGPLYYKELGILTKEKDRWENSIPYVIVYCMEDLIVDSENLIREQYTPHMQKQYGSDLVAAQEEFKRLKGETDDINSVKIVPHPAAQRHSYTVSGIPANDSYRGIIIEDGQKYIRR